MTALFDFDGVVMDTEELYTVFWDRMGEKYLGVKNLSPSVKGQTLFQIYMGSISQAGKKTRRRSRRN